MPYTKPKDRIKAMETGPEAPGDLTYLIYCLVVDWVYNQGGGMSYTRAAHAVGVLETAKLEFCRKHLNPYEDIKEGENGDVDVNEASYVAHQLRRKCTKAAVTTKKMGPIKPKGRRTSKRFTFRDSS